MSATVPHISFDSYIAANDKWEVNGRRATRRQRDQMMTAFQSQASLSHGAKSTQCGFCQTQMETPSFCRENLDTEEWHVDRTYSLAHCPYCCHWKFWASESTNKCMDPPTNVIAESVARKFDASLPEGCVTELAIQLRQNSSLWHSVEPRRMERLVADLFRANYGHAEVIHVGKPGDLGIDILFVDASNFEWLIQVKRKGSPESVEGFETLQRLLGTLVLEGKLHGIIATTAKRFSRQLLKQKQRAESRGFFIELIDRGKLNRMLSPILPNRPWLDLMNADFFWALDAEVRDYFTKRTTAPAESLL